MNKETLAADLASGNSVRALAAKYGCAKSTVQYWMERFELTNARATGPRTAYVMYTCPICKCAIAARAKATRKYCSAQCCAVARAARTAAKLERNEFKRDWSRKHALLKLQGCVCAVCHRTEWEGQPIPLVLDHIDGHASNNDVSNLRLVCGNCNMQLPTFAGRNRGHGRHARRQRYAIGKSS